ncbi:MAG: hypothetical protein WBR24_24100 [Desulfobacterales bacterium]|jgi:hypothetical protein
MRYFELLNFQQFVLYLLPAWVFILVFAAGLSFTHFRTKESEKKLSKIIEKYPGGIEGRNAPFPLFLYLTIAGTVLWALAYILLNALLGVKI